MTRSDPFRAGRRAGWLYIAASVGFLLVFSWLAKRFGYPDVLDQPAESVLPNLLALGSAGRAVWVIYALLPLLLIPAAVGAKRALREHTRGTRRMLRVAVVCQWIAAVAMTIGLARWSTLQWSLAERWAEADAGGQAAITERYDALNLYLGNGIGEFLGELTLYGSFAAFGLAMWLGGSRKTAGLASVTAAFGWVAMFRNMTPLVQPASDVANVLLPLFLIVFGVLLVRGVQPAGPE